MRVVITGGAGFIGRRLADRVLAAGQLTGPSGHAEVVDEVVLVDVAHPSGACASDDPRIRRVTGDIADVPLMASVTDRDDLSIFHLAAMVSAGCEQDFDGAMHANLDGTRVVFESARARPSCPRVVFASSIAAFGGPAVTDTVTDDTKLTPETTYGMLKAIGELLLNDYTRRGFVDGRTCRLPTVIIRPGRPNAAASSWVSGVFREPIGGRPAVVPIDLDIPVPLTGYSTVVENLLRMHEVDGALIGADRAVNLPAVCFTARQMIEAVSSTVNDRELGQISHRIDPSISKLFAGWAQRSRFDRATELGLEVDESLQSVIQTYIRDYAPTT
jgi:nucleoside-diphosphate-sugar epimerase